MKALIIIWIVIAVTLLLTVIVPGKEIEIYVGENMQYDTDLAGQVTAELKRINK